MISVAMQCQNHFRLPRSDFWSELGLCIVFVALKLLLKHFLFHQSAQFSIVFVYLCFICFSDMLIWYQIVSYKLVSVLIEFHLIVGLFPLLFFSVGSPLFVKF